LRDGTTGAGTRRSWISNALITGQLALSLVLLVAAGLFVRALDRAARVDPGFDPRGVTVVSLDTRTWGYDDVRGRQFYHTVLDRMAAVPGVTSVSVASFAPLTTRSLNDSVTLASGERGFAWYVGVSEGYFRTLGMPIIAGRPISSTDNERAPLVAVVNETFAKRLAPNGDALGKTFMRGKQPVTVVGIARDAKYATFDEAAPSMMFLSIDQAWQTNQTLLVRGLSPAQLAHGLHDIVRAIDPLLPVPATMTLGTASGISVLPQRIALIVTGTLGGIGLLLAVVGLYGVIAYSVSRRTRELGVRIALGASRTNVLALVLGDGLRLTAVGVLVGLILSAAATRVIAGLLFDVSALDAVTFLGMSLLLVVVAVLATYIPARRAARLDPMSALRSD
jgi:predicted permease